MKEKWLTLKLVQLSFLLYGPSNYGSGFFSFGILFTANLCAYLVLKKKWVIHVHLSEHNDVLVMTWPLTPSYLFQTVGHILKKGLRQIFIFDLLKGKCCDEIFGIQFLCLPAWRACITPAPTLAACIIPMSVNFCRNSSLNCVKTMVN